MKKIILLNLNLLFAAQGDLDTTLNPTGAGTGIPGVVQTQMPSSSVSIINSITLQADGKIIVAGSSSFGGTHIAIARYNTDGSLDNTFGINGIVESTINTLSEANAVQIQNDGKIVIAGYTAKFGGITNFLIARYNINGSLDTTFNSTGPIAGVNETQINESNNSKADSLATQKDGKFVLGGFSVNGSITTFALARYNTDGSLDTIFNPSGNPAGTVQTQINNTARINSIAIQADGKIVAGGRTISDITKFALARYNIDGSLDTTFSLTGDIPGVIQTQINTTAQIFSVAIQADGKIVAGGSSFISGLGRFTIARYNTDGSLDTTFSPTGTIPGVAQTPINTYAQIFSIAMQSDSKIVAAGEALSGVNQFAVARYNTDGSLDTTFSPTGTIPGVAQTPIHSFSRIVSIAIQSDGKIVAGGYNVDSAIAYFTTARYLASSTLIQSLITIAIKNKYGGNGSGA